MRAQLAQQRLEGRFARLARDHDLQRPALQEVDGDQHLAEGRRIAVQELGLGQDRALGPVGQLTRTCQLGQAQQVQRVHSVARGQRPILRPLEPRDQVILARGRGEEAVVLAVGEARLDFELQCSRALQPGGVEIRLVQVEQALDQEHVVVEPRGEVRPAAARGREQAPVRAAHRAPDELGGAARGFGVARLAEDLRGLGQGRDRQPVPGREHLVVRPGRHARAAGLEEPGAHLGHGGDERLDLDAELRGDALGRLGSREDARSALEVPALAHPEPGRGVLAEPRAEHGLQLRRRPAEETPFLALAVGVLRAREAALGGRHLAQHPVARVARHGCKALFARELEGLQVGRDEQRVVVEHLLEVRDEPLAVGAVAVEAAAELVADPPARHALEREQRQLARGGLAGARGVAHAQAEVQGVRELRSIPKAPPERVERLLERRERAVEDLRVQFAAGVDPSLGGDPVAQALALLGDTPAVLLPGPREAQQHLREPGPAPGAVRREVRPAVEGLERGCQEDAHRPAALAAQALDGFHVDLVQVGPLLAVHLDVDEVLVHQARDLFALEGLALHDVAPVAGRVAHGEEDGLLLDARALQRLGAPGKPVHRVVGVLKQVGARLARETVGRTFGRGVHRGGESTKEEATRRARGLSFARPGPRRARSSAVAQPWITARPKARWTPHLCPRNRRHR